MPFRHKTWDGLELFDCHLKIPFIAKLFSALDAVDSICPYPKTNPLTIAMNGTFFCSESNNKYKLIFYRSEEILIRIYLRISENICQKRWAEKYQSEWGIKLSLGHMFLIYVGGKKSSLLQIWCWNTCHLEFSWMNEHDKVTMKNLLWRILGSVAQLI